MVMFKNDYSAGAHPKVMQRLMETNLEPLVGYGNDGYCESAREKSARRAAVRALMCFSLSAGRRRMRW